MQMLHMICGKDDRAGSEVAGSDDESLLPFADMLSSFTNLTLLKWQHYPRKEARCAYAPVLAESLRQLASLQDLEIDAGVYTPLRVPMPPTVVVVVVVVAAAAAAVVVVVAAAAAVVVVVVVVVVLAVARSLLCASWSCYGCLYVHARRGPLSIPATDCTLLGTFHKPQHNIAWYCVNAALNKSQCVRLH
jgi:hypothetical protein